MKKSSLFIMVMCGFSTLTYAMSDDLTPYVGLNAQMRQAAFERGYGKGNFAKKMPQGEVFAGFKLNQYLGFELGYFRSTESHKSSTTTAPELILGAAIGGPNDYEEANSRSRIDGGSLSVVGFLPIAEDLQFLGALGLARMRVKLKYVPVSFSGIPYNNQAEIDRYTRDFVSYRYIPQLKIGAQQMLTPSVGLKALIGWDGTKRFNLLTNKQGTAARVSLKNSYNVGLGLTWYFN